MSQNLSGCDFKYALDFILYGLNGVMGDLEPLDRITSHELGIVIDVVADSQENANTVCSVTRSTLLHHGYEGRIATAGNLAFPYSPSDIQVGAVTSSLFIICWRLMSLSGYSLERIMNSKRAAYYENKTQRYCFGDTVQKFRPL